MIELILHPDDEIKLINLQKEIIKKYNDDFKFVRQMPLWIKLENFEEKKYSKDDLKLIAKKITDIQIQKPELKNDFIICPVFIFYDDKKLSADLPILKNIKKDSETKKDINLCNENDFPLNIKIFRIANTIIPYKNSIAIQEYIWKKLT